MKKTGKPSAKKQAALQSRDELLAAARSKEVDPLQQFNVRSLAIRVGIPAAILWLLAIVLPGWIPKAVMGVLTVIVAGLILWVVRFARRSRAVAQIVRQADTPAARKEAIEKLGTDFKKDDAAALFARAQLELQEDPRKALKTLESIKVDKVMAPIADEARAQRAMIHLMLGETDEARVLVDVIDMTRHKEPRTRATLAAIVGEGWARTGQAKRAVELLETFDPNDETYVDLRPQLLRARAFAYAWSNDMKRMKQTLRALSGLNAQYLSGFITKKKNPMGVPSRGVHPMLEKEAYEMVVRSGLVPKKMEIRRG